MEGFVTLAHRRGRERDGGSSTEDWDVCAATRRRKRKWNSGGGSGAIRGRDSFRA